MGFNKEERVYDAIAEVCQANWFDEATFKDVRNYCIYRWGWHITRKVFSPLAKGLVEKGNISNPTRGFYKIRIGRDSYVPTEIELNKISVLPKIEIGIRYFKGEYPESKLPHPYEDLTKQDPVLLF